MGEPPLGLGADVEAAVVAVHLAYTGATIYTPANKACTNNTHGTYAVLFLITFSRRRAARYNS